MLIELHARLFYFILFEEFKKIVIVMLPVVYLHVKQQITDFKTYRVVWIFQVNICQIHAVREGNLK